MQVTRTKLAVAVGKLTQALLCSVKAARTFSGNRQAEMEACDLLEYLLLAAERGDGAELRAIARRLEGRAEDDYTHSLECDDFLPDAQRSAGSRSAATSVAVERLHPRPAALCTGANGVTSEDSASRAA